MPWPAVGHRPWSGPPPSGSMRITEGAELGQRHTAGGAGDEAGALDDVQTRQRPPAHQLTRSRTAASPWPPPMHIVSRP